MLPDSTGTDLDQHLSNLVSGGGTSPSTQMTNPSGQLLTNGGGAGSQTSISTPPNSLPPVLAAVATRQQYSNSSTNSHHHHEYIQSSGQNGPRSLSDSSQAESPVQDDLLSSNTPTLGGNSASFHHQTNQNSYGSPTSSCNGSIYPVLPASILYSQLYTAANQGGFHTHGLGGGGGGGGGVGGQNSVHGELQTVMDHLATTGSQRHQLMAAGHTDLTIIGNCGSAARGGAEEGARQALRGQQGGPAENGNSVWRPY